MKYFVSILAVLFSLSAHAGELVTDAEQIKGIFNNQTVDAHRFKDDSSWTNYFAADGSMKRVTDSGDKDSGVWHVNDKAEHCVKWDSTGKEWCRAILKGDSDGVYFRVKVKGEGGFKKLVRFKNFRGGNDLPK